MTFRKDPDAELDYTIDWSVWLDGDQIISSEWIVPAGLIRGSSSHTTTSCTVWLSGGSVGQSYIVTDRITTAAGRIEDRSFTVRVEER